MNSIQPITPERPSHEQWESIRFLIFKLWREEKKTLPFIILYLRHNCNLHVSSRTLKQKLQEWGLIKKMNPQDAEDLRAAQARLDALGQSGLLLLRGRLEQIKRVHDYQRRRRRAHDHRSNTPETTTNSTSSQVIVLSCHPRLRPEPALALLGKFESLLREMQLLLHASKEASMCIPGNITLDWKTSTTETEILERSLHYSTGESIGASEEGEFVWAGLCWKSALLTLEDLVWEPDLNIWICFIRCCVRLARFQAEKVAKQFLWKLRWLRDELPASAPHRALIHALSEIRLCDLVDGCLFVLEANLRIVELLWPLERRCCIEYQLHLNEERLYQGFDALRDMPYVYDFETLIGHDLGHSTSIQRSWISTCMLFQEYDKAEVIARNTISQLERGQQPHANIHQGKMLSVSLAYWYSLLGAIQYHHDDHTQSRTSYLTCLQFYQESKEIHRDYALQPVQLRRILVLLRWLNATLMLSQEKTTLDLGVHEQKLETEFKLHLQSRENAAFRRRSDRTLIFPSKIDVRKKKSPNEYIDLRSIPKHTRVVQRPVFMGVDHDKDQDMGAPGQRSMAPSLSHIGERFPGSRGGGRGLKGKPKAAPLAPPPDGNG